MMLLICTFCLMLTIAGSAMIIRGGLDRVAKAMDDCWDESGDSSRYAQSN